MPSCGSHHAFPVRAVSFAVALAALTAGCGGGSSQPADDPAAAAARTAGAGAEEATTTEGAAASAGARAQRAADPRQGGLEIALGEWAVTPEARVIRPGAVTFVVTNRGRVAHAFELKAEAESSGHGSGHGGLEVESRLIRPGETVRFRLRLASGSYEIECWVANHDDLGMVDLLEVREDAPLVRPRAGAENTVRISGFAYRPGGLTVGVGQAVSWVNQDSAPHTVTDRGGGFGSDTLEPGARFRATFDRAGTYRYFCALHPEMKGTVTVR